MVVQFRRSPHLGVLLGPEVYGCHGARCDLENGEFGELFEVGVCGFKQIDEASLSFNPLYGVDFLYFKDFCQ